MMTMDEKALALEKLAQNDAFMAAYQKVESKEDLQKLFADNGVALEKEEIDAFVAALNAGAEELSEDALDGVAGGVAATKIFEWAWKIVKKTGKWAWEKGKELANWENSR